MDVNQLNRETVFEFFFGVSYDSFLQTVLGKKYVTGCILCSGIDAGQPKTPVLISRRDFAETVNLSADRTNALKVVNSDRSQQPAITPRGKVDLQQLWMRYHDGQTVVYEGAHHHLNVFSTLARLLSLATSRSVHANLYLTPAWSRGYNLHYDVHDVIVLQLDGTKTWRIYAKPASVPDHPASFNPDTPHDVLAETLIDEKTLEPGDCLYLPAGFPHIARTTGDASLHVTFGLRAITIFDILLRALSTDHNRMGILREPAPANLLSDPTSIQAIAGDIRNAALEAVAGLDFTQALSSCRNRVADEQGIFPTPLTAGLRVSDLHDDDTVVLRDLPMTVKRLSTSQWMLQAGFKTLTLNKIAYATLERLEEHRQLTIRELKDTNGAYRLPIDALASLGVIDVVTGRQHA